MSLYFICIVTKYNIYILYFYIISFFTTKVTKRLTKYHMKKRESYFSYYYRRLKWYFLVLIVDFS